MSSVILTIDELKKIKDVVSSLTNSLEREDLTATYTVNEHNPTCSKINASIDGVESVVQISTSQAPSVSGVSNASKVVLTKADGYIDNNLIDPSSSSIASSVDVEIDGVSTVVSPIGSREPLLSGAENASSFIHTRTDTGLIDAHIMPPLPEPVLIGVTEGVVTESLGVVTDSSIDVNNFNILGVTNTTATTSITDGVASSSSGNLTGAVDGTIDNTVHATTLTDGTAVITGGTITATSLNVSNTLTPDSLTDGVMTIDNAGELTNGVNVTATNIKFDSFTNPGASYEENNAGYGGPLLKTNNCDVIHPFHFDSFTQQHGGTVDDPASDFSTITNTGEMQNWKGANFTASVSCENCTVENDCVIGGNLEVQGSQINITAETVEMNTNNLVIGNETSSDAIDAWGMKFSRDTANSSNSDAFFGYVENITEYGGSKWVAGEYVDGWAPSAPATGTYYEFDDNGTTKYVSFPDVFSSLSGAPAGTIGTVSSGTIGAVTVTSPQSYSYASLSIFDFAAPGFQLAVDVLSAAGGDVYITNDSLYGLRVVTNFGPGAVNYPATHHSGVPGGGGGGGPVTGLHDFEAGTFVGNLSGSATSVMVEVDGASATSKTITLVPTGGAGGASISGETLTDCMVTIEPNTYIHKDVINPTFFAPVDTRLDQLEIDIPAYEAVVGLTAITNANFTTALSDWAANPVTAAATYGDISEWDTSAVTNLDNAFLNTASFVGIDIKNWNTSNVTSMDGAFKGATGPATGIENWNTSNVTSMAEMFSGNTTFNTDISKWNVSQATSMVSMFENCSSFDQDLSSWNVSNVVSMQNMFKHCYFNNGGMPISWNATKVTNMSSMFENEIVLHNKVNSAADIEANYDKVTDNVWIWRANAGALKNRANGANSTSSIYWEWAEGKTSDGKDTLNFLGSHYDVIQDMKTSSGGSFSGAQGMISSGRVHYVMKVTENNTVKYYDIEFLSWQNGSGGGGFSYNRIREGFTQSINTWNVDSLLFATDMYDGVVQQFDFSNLNPTNFTVFTGLQTSYDTSIFTSGFDNDTIRPFLARWKKHKENGTLPVSWPDISTWDVSAVTDMSGLFSEFGNHDFATHTDISSWTVSAVTSMSQMFKNCTNFNIDITGWDVTNVTNFEGTFMNCTAFNQDVLNQWTFTNATSTAHILYNAAAFVQTMDDPITVFPSLTATSITTDLFYTPSPSGFVDTAATYHVKFPYIAPTPVPVYYQFDDSGTTKYISLPAPADITDPSSMPANLTGTISSAMIGAESIASPAMFFYFGTSSDFDMGLFQSVNVTKFTANGNLTICYEPSHYGIRVVTNYASGSFGQVDYTATYHTGVPVVVTAAGGDYYFDGVQNSTLTVDATQNVTYKFDMSDSSLSTHPLRFSFTSDGTHNGGTEITAGVTVSGTAGTAGAYIEFVPTVADGGAGHLLGGGELYYYCVNHPGMGGIIT